MQIYLRFAEPQPNFAAFAATLVQGERKCKFIMQIYLRLGDFWGECLFYWLVRPKIMNQFI